ncbi:MAG: CoA-binding protein [Saprospiraceae bacterium]|nr:CoA-binding protein [Saprospiraceae bacterium]MBP7699581.1 CoA-binding protein [Saprospiraceae bacterium]
MDKKTVVLGASTKPERYSFLATRALLRNGHTVVPIGNKAGKIDGQAIFMGKPHIENIDTVTLYLNPERQKEYYDYIISLQPKRIIFNPGTENPELMQLAKNQKISTELACTLVLLSTSQY